MSERFPGGRRGGLRKTLWVTAALLGVLLVVDTAWWWWLTGRLEQEAAAWQQTRRDAGEVADGRAPQRGGWPLTARVTYAGVALGTGGAGGLTWRAGRAEVSTALWRPEAAALSLEGDQSLQIGGAAPVPVMANVLKVALDRRTGALVVTGRGVEAALPEGVLLVGRLEARAEALEVRLSLGGVSLPWPDLALGGSMRWLEVRARSTVPLPPLQDLAAAATRWRDAGGVLLLDGVSLRWGPLDAEGQARMELGAALQPQGSAALRLTGYAAAIEALEHSGALGRNQGRVAATLLGLLASPGQGGVAQATVPLRLEGGVLSLGAMPLVRAPAIAWP